MSKEEKFTKGPWKVLNNLSYSDRKYHYQILTKDAGLWVANTEDCDNEEEEANANLIAMSPNMYRELEDDAKSWRDMAEWLQKQMGNIALVHSMFMRAEQIDALLAKARGEGGEND